MASHEFALLNLDQAYEQALKNGLQLLKANSEICPVLNGMGCMEMTYSTTSKAFLEIAMKPEMKVLDIGAAYGQVCLQALRNGAQNYVVNDMDGRHLQILALQVKHDFPDKKFDGLSFLVAEFPDKRILEVYKPKSFDAILLNNVLHFMLGESIIETLTQCKTLLKPGGKIMASFQTPYNVLYAESIRKKIIEENEAFLALAKFQPKNLPGFLPEMRAAYDMDREECRNYMVHEPPVHVLVMTAPVVEKIFREVGFQVESCFYEPAPNWFPLDGRERTICFAESPS